MNRATFTIQYEPLLQICWSSFHCTVLIVEETQPQGLKNGETPMPIIKDVI